MIPVRANHWPRVRETTCMSVCIYSYVHVYVGEYTYGRERAGPRREYKNARSGKDPRAPSTGKKAYKSMCVCVWIRGSILLGMRALQQDQRDLMRAALC